MNAIQGSSISYRYEFDEQPALDQINIEVKCGELLAILGCNGCGKSTLLKHFNVLLPLQQGELTVAGLNVKNPKNRIPLRQKCGMVFQNPDNQFVSSLVSEDITFGLKNYNTPPAEIPERIKLALHMAGLDGCEQRTVHTLSGGQKQRAALAGILALNPDLLLLDEITSMLDPEGREEVLDAIQTLHHKEHKTIIMITHYVEEALLADRVCLMDQGCILAEGSPREILTDPDLLEKAGLLPPLPVRLYFDLKKSGQELPFCPLTEEELVKLLCPLF